MTALTIAITAGCLGGILGLRFSVFVLLPAIIVIFTVILTLSMAHGSSAWIAPIIAILTVAALQAGYLVGAVMRNRLSFQRPQQYTTARRKNDGIRYSRRHNLMF